LAQRLGVKEKDVVEMSQRMNGRDVSLESPKSSDSDDQQKNFIPSHEPGIESIVAGKEMKQKLNGLLETLKGTLNDKQKMILDKRLLTDEPLTLQHIADKFAISRERVRQIEGSLLKKLRIFIEKEMPDIVYFFDGERMVV
jgi:RNA polymerase sigma-32 factor